MVLLPSLVLGAEIEGSRVLQVWRKHHSLVSSLSRQLHAEIPGIKREEDEVLILRGKLFGSKRVESVDGVPESTSVPDMFPG